MVDSRSNFSHACDCEIINKGITMADHLNNKLYRTWIATDIAKVFNAVLSETNEDKRQPFRIANSAQDHDRFIDFLKSLP